MLLADDDTEQHCYFVITIVRPAALRNIIGEYMSAHAHEWEGKILPKKMALGASNRVLVTQRERLSAINHAGADAKIGIDRS